MIPNPTYSGKGVVVDEARPDLFRIPRGTGRVSFENHRSAPVAQGELLSAIRNAPERADVDFLEIRRTSLMTSPWVAPLFPNVERVGLEGGRLNSLHELTSLRRLSSLSITAPAPGEASLDVLPALPMRGLAVDIAKRDDVAHVASCRSLQRLSLGRWPYPNLEPIAALSLEGLKLLRGRIETTQGLCGSLDWLELAGCRYLTSLTGLTCRFVRLLSCSRFQIESADQVRSLRVLSVMGAQRITSLEFVRRCTSLEQLHLSGCLVVTHDFAPIAESRSMREVFLSRPVSKAQIEGIARANRALFVSNGRVWYYGGVELSAEEFCRRRKELSDAG